jgi:hypothetical protein
MSSAFQHIIHRQINFPMHLRSTLYLNELCFIIIYKGDPCTHTDTDTDTDRHARTHARTHARAQRI